jgi:hypothetical protein
VFAAFEVLESPGEYEIFIAVGRPGEPYRQPVSVAARSGKPNGDGDTPGVKINRCVRALEHVLADCLGVLYARAPLYDTFSGLCLCKKIVVVVARAYNTLAILWLEADRMSPPTGTRPRT